MLGFSTCAIAGEALTRACIRICHAGYPTQLPGCVSWLWMAERDAWQCPGGAHRCGCGTPGMPPTSSAPLRSLGMTEKECQAQTARSEGSLRAAKRVRNRPQVDLGPCACGFSGEGRPHGDVPSTARDDVKDVHAKPKRRFCVPVFRDAPTQLSENETPDQACGPLDGRNQCSDRYGDL